MGRLANAESVRTPGENPTLPSPPSPLPSTRSPTTTSAQQHDNNERTATTTAIHNNHSNMKTTKRQHYHYRRRQFSVMEYVILVLRITWLDPPHRLHCASGFHIGLKV